MNIYTPVFLGMPIIYSSLDSQKGLWYVPLYLTLKNEENSPNKETTVEKYHMTGSIWLKVPSNSMNPYIVM